MFEKKSLLKLLVIYLKLKWSSKTKYLHLPSIFPIKCVGGPSVFMRA